MVVEELCSFPILCWWRYAVDVTVPHGIAHLEIRNFGTYVHTYSPCMVARFWAFRVFRLEYFSFATVFHVVQKQFQNRSARGPSESPKVE